ncbi:nucleoside hydrolase [Didymella exigua CBS 183.55]|uniref:Nucleoside hydrolase n=1 Tax=Didymella exigua CBS 183.55 TaxID=1150837 RepID=A0A6A5RTU7_9PLEO|nr:nucleoside hydrolase [Didymella exigua CBS 183.55]KAF1930790.1 nucleoside hydrolase [Didymella exigua CBS 183.55]
MAPNKVIIDTDPGVDDVIAMLLAFSAKPDELDILMLSLTFGNVDVQSCLRNVVTLFHYIEKERAWRESQGRPKGFETLDMRKPIVAVGATKPLAEHMMVADFFHGIDGLGGIHNSHPHLSPAETWRSLFKPIPENLSPEDAAELQAVKDQHSLFEPSLKPAHEQMLELLRDNEPDTITIVAVGPLTNLALAAAKDPETFLRVKEVVVMGGAIDAPGNMTPGAEFNTYADSVASARVFALTNPNPQTTMPPTLSGKGQLPPYPEKLSRPLKLKLFPLDTTEQHMLPQSLYTTHTTHSSLINSPLTDWSTLFLLTTFKKLLSLNPNQDASKLGLQLHDPLCIWYALNTTRSGWEFKTEDVRIETAGQWTRGCCIVDRRGRPVTERTTELDDEVVGDAGWWGDSRRGNRVSWCTNSPGTEAFAHELLERVFGKIE